MHNTKRIPIVQLNDFLICKLCSGYYIDATTIIECLHTFCRSCIVHYLEKNKYCPVCDVQVHKSRPLLNIRPDKIIQDIVYKLVPHLFQNEMCRRRQFYYVNSDSKPSNLEQCGEVSDQHILGFDETICLTLNYSGSTGPPRYLRCPAGLSIVHLQKLLRSKYGLPDHYRVDIFHNQDCLSPHLTLIDIAYIYLWRRKEPLGLTYRIYEKYITNLKVDISPTVDLQQGDVQNETVPPSDNNPEEDNPSTNWKEVQLRISETGEMCFTDVDSMVILNEEVAKSNNKDDESLPNSDPMKNMDVNIELETNSGTDNSNLKNEANEKVSDSGTESSGTSSLIPTNVDCDNKSSAIANCVSISGSTSTSSETSTVGNNTSLQSNSKNPTNVTTDTKLLFNGKHKTQRNTEEEPVAKQAKPTILNHTLNSGIHHLSNNHPLKRNSQIRKSIESTSSSDTSMESLTTMVIDITPTTNPINYVNSTTCSSIQTKATIVNKESSSISSSGSCSTSVLQWSQNRTPTAKLPCYSPKITQNPVINVPKVQTAATIIKSKVPITTLNHKMPAKNKPTNSMAYKTLREPPKTWNPQIPRSLLLKGSADQRDMDVKNTKPAKFFKMRNNMPRYLGNPASGVKPLYQVHTSPEKDKCENLVKADKTEIKKHSIVKIDPKTLKPISEKAPECSSLSSQSELRINTSSVPIFSPLKLQSSPKGDRRSPKSPQSPKTVTSPSSKRDKLNLNYIPPNPFIPNLSSPTLNPNQFLYPPGFPIYDHRLVAAYHNLLFGRRLAYAASHPGSNLNFDLIQRKAFDLPACTSPVAAAPPLQFIGKEKIGPRKVSSAKAQNTESGVIDLNSTQHNKTKQKQSKESSKSDKSLENTVEKLTQNRVSEFKVVDKNGSEKESSSDKETPAIEKEPPSIECPILAQEEKSNDVSCTTTNVNNSSISNNCIDIDDTKKCIKSKLELETVTNIQSMQNGDKTVSNNNTIESISFENDHKV